MLGSGKNKLQRYFFGEGEKPRVVMLVHCTPILGQLKCPLK